MPFHFQQGQDPFAGLFPAGGAAGPGPTPLQTPDIGSLMQALQAGAPQQIVGTPLQPQIPQIPQAPPPFAGLSQGGGGGFQGPRAEGGDLGPRSGPSSVTELDPNTMAAFKALTGIDLAAMGISFGALTPPSPALNTQSFIDSIQAVRDAQARDAERQKSLSNKDITPNAPPGRIGRGNVGGKNGGGGGKSGPGSQGGSDPRGGSGGGPHR